MLCVEIGWGVMCVDWLVEALCVYSRYARDQYGLEGVRLDFIHACMCTCVHVYMCTCLHAYMRSCVHVYMRACVHAYMCT